ncbi:MAG: NAD-dependent epimerase/dehydratase family protein [candidate division Zixibacteria bacterium]|nr:NAD-dependent epimerase/dehydratase family protein [candidate division Zixibacteria bacterium]
MVNSLSRNKIQTEIDPTGSKCLVTGANGFVGSHLCEKLLSVGCRVCALVRKTSDLRFLKDLHIEYRYGDVCHPQSLDNAVRDIDFIFHSAGLTKAKDYEDFYKVNHIGTLSLLEAALNNGEPPKRFIYISSLAACGPGENHTPVTEEHTPNPVTTYGKSKLRGEEEVVKRFDSISSTIIRPPSIYGPRDKEIYTFFKTASMGIKPYFGREEAILSMVYIDDLIHGIIKAAFSSKTTSEIYFTTDGEVYTWDDVVSCLLGVFDKKGIHINIPISLFLWLGSFSEQITKAMGKAPMFTREKAYEITRRNWACSCRKAMEVFGYSPKVKFSEGAKLTAKWYKEKKWL